MYRVSVRCCRCGSRRLLDPFMGTLLFICQKCALDEAEKLIKKFHNEGVVSGDELATAMKHINERRKLIEEYLK